MKNERFSEIASLFFTTRQIIRANLSVRPDVYAWLRCETLRFISQAHEPTMHDVAGFLRVKAPSATSLVANLAKAGLVSRKSSAKDKRVVRISLTAKGKRKLDHYERDAAVTMRKVFARLDEGETKDLIDILRHVRDIHLR